MSDELAAKNCKGVEVLFGNQLIWEMAGNSRRLVFLTR
jgi:hypothetical protein